MTEDPAHDNNNQEEADALSRTRTAKLAMLLVMKMMAMMVMLITQMKTMKVLPMVMMATRKTWTMYSWNYDGHSSRSDDDKETQSPPP